MIFTLKRWQLLRRFIVIDYQQNLAIKSFHNFDQICEYLLER